MRYQIPVYRAEREAGLAHAIQANASIAYQAPLEPLEWSEPLAGALTREAIERAVAALGRVPDSHEDPELFYMKDVLVTSGWNLNDDVFDRLELWLARSTSVDKPLNFEHDQSDILGHIVAAQAVDADMAALADDLAVDDLPDRFHIVNGSVIYRHIGDLARRERIERTIAEIQKGEWAVSMEALFRGFDYAVRDPEGVDHVVARNEKTSWLTAYLRAYPPAKDRPVLDPHWGTGVYLEKSTGARFEVGRVMRNITFCGKGLVRRPGNPDSVILASSATFRPRADGPVYLTPTELPTLPTAENAPMSDVATAEAARLQARIDELVAANERLTTQVDSLRGKDLESKIASLESELSVRAARATALEAQLGTVQSGLSDVTRRAESAEASLAVAGEELAALRAEKTRAARKALLVAKNAPEAVAAELLAKLAVLDEAAFASTVEAIAASWAAPKAPAKPSATAAIDNAKLEAEATLAAASTPAGEAEAAFARISDFMAESILQAPSPARGRSTQ